MMENNPVISWTPNKIRKTERAADLNFVFAISALIKIVVFFSVYLIVIWRIG